MKITRKPNGDYKSADGFTIEKPEPNPYKRGTNGHEWNLYDPEWNWVTSYPTKRECVIALSEEYESRAVANARNRVRQHENARGIFTRA